MNTTLIRVKPGLYRTPDGRYEIERKVLRKTQCGIPGRTYWYVYDMASPDPNYGYTPPVCGSLPEAKRHFAKMAEADGKGGL